MPFKSRDTNSNENTDVNEHDNDDDDDLKFPYANKIILFMLISMVLILSYAIIYSHLNFTLEKSKGNLLDPCNFTDMLDMHTVAVLKLDLEIYEKKISSVLDVLLLDISDDFKKELIHFNEIYQKEISKIQQQLEYQKNHRQKCFIKNYNIKANDTLFQKRVVVSIAFPLSIASYYISLIYLYKSYNFELSESKKSGRKKVCIVMVIPAIVICFTIFQTINE